MRVFLAARLTARADDLETRLREMDTETLVAQVRQRGNAKQGGLIFHKSAAACINCHGGGEDVSPLGPDLAEFVKK